MTVSNENLSLLLLKARENSVSYVRPILAEVGLTEQQWRVIRTLKRDGEMNAQDLAGESCILSPSLSRILNRLENEKVILKKVDSKDQRALNIKLSAKGSRLHDRVAPKIEKQYKVLTQAVGKDTVSKLIVLLETFSSRGKPNDDG
ncbi:homoprotocatechuate degradation operon regulator HpaR [Teredinibacter purpureus]|uniref:homoprotocatechuate degradation operon regulator HpaR n=1 Tax=Teredinibacter purpureus TaxID=2731756 RepID=UPI0005F7CE20|nr:homoprotocatechuate degradation operon regulator HpaR [Teredinibacter purpureus]